MDTAPSTATARAYVTAASGAPAFWMIGVLWRLQASGIQTGGSFCLLDQWCSPGSGPERHDHPQDEGLYVVDGSVAFQAGGAAFKAGPGSFVAVPRHTEHSFVVEEEANLINFYLPAGFEMFLVGGAVPATTPTLPPADLPMPPEAQMRRLSDEFGGMPLTRERSTRPNPDAIAQPLVATAATARSHSQSGARWSVLADGASTGGSYCAFELVAPRDYGIAPHLRDLADEVYCLLEGEAELLLDDRRETLEPGSMGFAPRGTVTALRVTGDTVRLLVVHTAPGYERLLAAISEGAALSTDAKRIRRPWEHR